jgi:putative transposase
LCQNVDGPIRSARVIEVLSRLASGRGAATFLRSDDRSSYGAKYQHGVDRAWQALAEWRHGKLQRQVSRRVSKASNGFVRRAEAKVIIEAWRPYTAVVHPREFIAEHARA